MPRCVAEGSQILPSCLILGSLSNSQAWPQHFPAEPSQWSIISYIFLELLRIHLNHLFILLWISYYLSLFILKKSFLNTSSLAFCIIEGNHEGPANTYSYLSIVGK